jgi:DNA-binding NarL/FixJ family response regulator
MARAAGVKIVAEQAEHEITILAIDASTPLPASAEALSLLSSPAAKLLLLWMGDAPTRGVLSRLRRTGAAGIVPADIVSVRLQVALQAIHDGFQVVDSTLEGSLRSSKSQFQTAAFQEELTAREQEVLSMMAEGLSNKEISSRLNISTHTVKFHISSVLGKLGAASRTEAVSIGVKTGRVLI